MNVKLLTEHHLEFLSLEGGCTGSSESTLLKTPHCWKSHVAAHIVLYFCLKGNLWIFVLQVSHFKQLTFKSHAQKIIQTSPDSVN